MKMSAGVVLLVLGQGLVACAGAGSSSVPPAPSPVLQITPTPAPQPRPLELVVFTDSTTGFSTSDVRDVQEQIVRFNTADELIWVASDTRFQEFIADGNFIAYHHKADRFWQIRFGTKDGRRQAYLTNLNGLAPTILDLDVDERGDLKIVETSVPVRGS